MRPCNNNKCKTRQCLVRLLYGSVALLFCVTALVKALQTFNMPSLGNTIASVAVAVASVTAKPYNTFDGDGFPACRAVASVHNATSVDEMVSIVKQAVADGTPVRASGKGHMW
jgi:FAD/FMN-containing dehydrogenase